MPDITASTGYIGHSWVYQAGQSKVITVQTIIFRGISKSCIDYTLFSDCFSWLQRITKCHEAAPMWSLLCNFYNFYLCLRESAEKCPESRING